MKEEQKELMLSMLRAYANLLDWVNSGCSEPYEEHEYHNPDDVRDMMELLKEAAK